MLHGGDVPSCQNRTVSRRNFAGLGPTVTAAGSITVLHPVHLTIICVLADALFPGMFCRRIHLQPFLGLENVILRDNTVRTSAEAHAYTGGGVPHCASAAAGIRTALCYQRTYTRVLRPTLSTVFDARSTRIDVTCVAVSHRVQVFLPQQIDEIRTVCLVHIERERRHAAMLRVQSS